MDNIVLITIDSLHHDYIGHLSDKKGHTPQIDSLATDNISCERAYANGIPTYFAFRSILGGRREVEDERPIGIPNNWRTLAEAFSNMGYDTAGFNAANPWLTPNSNYHKGFDTFEDFLSDTGNSRSENLLIELIQKLQHHIPDNLHLRDKLGYFARLYCTITGNYPIESSETVTNRALEWLKERNTTQPFFLWLHYMDPHYPWTPSATDSSPLEIAKTWHQVSHTYNKSDRTPTQQTLNRAKSLYSGEVSTVDNSIGKLVDEVYRKEDSIVCVTADHGTELGDHGGFSHGPDSLYEEVTRVPIVIAGDDLPEKTITDPVQHIDIPTTLTELATSDESVCDKGWAGKNLLEEQRDFSLTQVIYDYNPAVSEAGDSNTLNAVMKWPWKLHWNRHTGTVELYHLDDDPKETKDVSDQNEDIVTQLQDLVREEQDCLDQEYRTAAEITRIRSRLSQMECR